MLHYKNKIRVFLVWLIEWVWFERFVMLVILTNCFNLAMYDYSDRNNETKFNKILEQIGFGCTLCFFVEFILKILGMGFIWHKNSYLRDGWNAIDFCVVLVGVIEFIPVIPNANLRALRTVRVMRPLRSINAIPGLRRQISSLIRSLPKLANVVLFLFFIFILFGIFGVQQFSGLFYNRCRLTEKPEENGFWPIDESITRLCSKPEDGGLYTCPEGLTCGNPQDYGLSLDKENIGERGEINYGITTFDNLGAAMVTLF